MHVSHFLVCVIVGIHRATYAVCCSLTSRLSRLLRGTGVVVYSARRRELCEIVRIHRAVESLNVRPLIRRPSVANILVRCEEYWGGTGGRCCQGPLRRKHVPDPVSFALCIVLLRIRVYIYMGLF